MKPKQNIIPIVILVLCILIFGFSLFSSSENKALITWGDRFLTWEDFELVDDMEDDYVALIYSDIQCPELITNENSRVYAFMNPNRSERLEDEYDNDEVLVHEQYHFNITEYCARLLRKEIVSKGLGGLSYDTMKSLRNKYSKNLDSLQNTYDSITDHSVNSKLQRYWELQIDDWLRQTAYYKNEDIYSYYNFTKDRTAFYKEVYFTLSYRLLLSYPVGKKDIQFGETYEIEYPTHGEQVVKFYKDGKLTNGGKFQSAIVRILKKKKGVVEVHYYNADNTYNTTLDAAVRKIAITENDSQTEQYFDANAKRVSKNSVFETRRKYNPNTNSYYASFFNKEGKSIVESEGIHHKKVTLDEKDRSIKVANYDRRHRLKNDTDFVAKYETAYDKNHVRLYNRMYDENGKFAVHLSDYHLAYEYDERGHVSRVTSLDSKGEKTYDHNGASIYEYTYDLHDRETSVKLFNAQHEPIIANDDYFQKVSDYDDQGRLLFEADYYPGYVLHFSNEKDGASKYSYENDSIKRIFNVDAYGNLFKNDYEIAIIIQTLNQKKRVIKEIYLDQNENYAKPDDGAVIYKYRYDNEGNRIEMAAHDSLGKPIAFEADVATIRWNYDSDGNKTKTTYFNTENELAHANDSVTYNVYKYTPKGFLYERVNLNIAGEPEELKGIYRSYMHIDKHGRDSIIMDYNTKNELKSRVAITKYFYNKYGKKIRVEFFDQNNRRIKMKMALVP